MTLFFVSVLVIAWMLFPTSIDIVELYKRSEQYDRAIFLLERIKKKEPDSIYFKKLQAGILMLAGRYNDAIEVLEHVVKNNPTDIDAYKRLSDAYMQTIRYKDAMKIYEKIVQFTPDDSEALINLRCFYRIYQCKSMAITNLEKYIRNFPDDISAFIELSRLYFTSDRLNDGIALLKKMISEHNLGDNEVIEASRWLSFLGREDELRDIYKKYETKPTDNINLRIQMAEYYLRKDEPDKAAKLYNELLPVSSHDNSNDITFGLAKAYIKMGEINKAESVFNKNIDFYSDTSSFFAEIGDVFLEQRNYDIAQKYYNTALDVNPNNLFAMKSMINFYEITDPSKTLAYIKKMYNINPDDPDIVYRMASYYETANNRKKSMSLFKKYLTIMSNNDYNDYTSLRRSAFANHKTGKLEIALAILGKARELFPEDIEIMNDYAEVLIDLKRYTEALKILNNING